MVTTSQKSYLDFNLSDLRGELSEVPESSGNIPNPDGIYANKVKSWTLGGIDPEKGTKISDNKKSTSFAPQYWWISAGRFLRLYGVVF